MCKLSAASSLQRSIPMHINKGKTIAQCMKARIDYVKNPDKTEEGEFISSYACAPESADQEFVLARNQYLMNADSGKKNEVIAYQLRQSFKPGEVSAEEANQIGYELAERLLHGEHAFIVATHTDRRHIHNHIVFCATALDCSHKFRNVWNSSRLVVEISDELCREHHLSIVQVPQNKTVSYEKWEGDKSKLTSRDSLRITIDAALLMQPDGFDALIEELDDQISALKSERNVLHAAIRQKQNRMKEINQLRQAIRNYRRTKDVYAQYKASGWSPKFYNEHRTEIEDHKKAQAVYSSVEGKMPTLKELSAEYDSLKSEKEDEDTALEELKPKLTTLNHIKYNFDVLERD